jgi:serine protease AprX
MADESMDVLREVRGTVQNRYGRDLAAKATDAFLRALTRPILPGGVAVLEAFEAVTGPTSAPPAVIEFTPRPEALDRARGMAEEARGTPVWSDVRDALGEVRRSWPELRLGTERLLRQARIASLRDDFYRAVRPVADQLERTSGGLLSPGLEVAAAARTVAPLTVTQVCWLNRTVRTLADPRALAEVAANDEVASFDVPRRLEPDLGVPNLAVGAQELRERTARTGRGVLIAKLDQESLAHPFLQERVINRRNYTQEPWGNPGPHGTAVAGILAADGGDVLTGMAPEATVYSYKVMATVGALSSDDFSGALAIQQALEDGADIANCSWGAGRARDGTSREARACNAAWALGLTIVKSAGNRGPGDGTLTTPADADGVIVAGATDRQGTAVQDYSSRGPTGHGLERPHLVAPGGTPDSGVVTCLVNGGVGDAGYGTSYAAPYVAGILALILEGEPDLPPEEQRERLLNLCTPFDNVPANTQGAGLISLANLP